MIKIQCIGHLGKDAIVNNVNGKLVINFSVAHTESFKDAQGEKKEKTTWVDCAYWTDRTAIAPYLKKGTQVYVEGQPEVRIYDNAQTGKSGATLSCRIGSVQLLNNVQKEASSGDEKPSSKTQNRNVETIEAVDDLPF